MKQLFLILIVLFTVLLGINYICDDKDSCLDSGVCKEGLAVKDNKTGKEFVVNIDSCKVHNGIWRSKYNDCVFN